MAKHDPVAPPALRSAGNGGAERGESPLSSAPTRPAVTIGMRLADFWSWFLLAVVAALVVTPMGALFYGAFRSDSPRAPKAVYTLNKVAEVFGGLFTGGWSQSATVNSILLALPVTLFASILGIFVAWLVTRTDLRGHRVFEIIFLVPMLYSPLIGAIGWSVLADSRTGLLNQFYTALTGLQGPIVAVDSYGGIVWVMVFHSMVYAFIMNVGTFRNLDPALEEAAAVSGANLWRRLTAVTLPMMSASTVASALFIFTLTLEAFAIPGFLGSQISFNTLAYAIYLRTHDYPSDFPGAAAGGLLLLAFTTIALYFYRRLIRRSEKFVTVTARGYKPARIQLGWLNPVMFTFCVLIFLIGEGLPLLAVFWRSLMKVRSVGIDFLSMSMGNYAGLFKLIQVRLAFLNSILISAGTAFLVILLGFLLAHRMVRRKRKDGAITLADYLIAIPLSVPGTVFGVAMLWVFVGTPIYMTVWILLLAFVTRYSVYGVRTLSAGIMQVDKSLEEAALVSGASTARTFLFVNLPLLRPVLASLWLLVFMLSMREISAAVILYGVKSVTMPILTWNYLSDGFYGDASALAIVQIIVMTVFLLLFRALFGVDVRMQSKE